MSENLFCRWEMLESKYEERDLIMRLLESVGADVQIVTYNHPETGEIMNVALENNDTGSIIIDFDLDGGDR